MSFLKALIDFLVALFSKGEDTPRVVDEKPSKRKYETLMKFPKKASIQYTQSFNSNDFDCKCKQLCDETLLDSRIPNLLQQLEDELGFQIIITSAYRCEQHNKNVGGSTTSTHLEGLAVDLWCEDMDKLAKAIERINPEYSIGRYNGFLHLDLREEGRRWDFRK